MAEGLLLPTNPASSTPRLENFNPREVPFQLNVLRHIRRDFDYEQGVAELLLSGSVGSAKSILAAHTVVTHVLNNPGAQVLIVRRVLKDLKNTFWRVMLSHHPLLREYYNKSEMTINLPNGSIIYGSSYDDGNYEKFRSYELSGAVIEEASEGKDHELYDEIYMRVGRLPHVKENFMLLITNPDSPSHYIFDRFMENPTPNRKVFYSLTEQNKFLKPSYIQNLKKNLPAKMAKRMLEGQWIEINTDVVYSDYLKERNFRDVQYIVNPQFPIHFSWDFNVAQGKPMSTALGQKIDGVWHWFAEIVIEGSRTLSILEEAASRGYLDWDAQWIINGDATGKANTSNSLVSNYDVIKNFLSNYQRKDGGRVRFKTDVPAANPPVVSRHNAMNTACHNALGQVHFYVYRGAPTLDKGMRLTALKKGGSYIEDDTKDYQHVTTAVGYAVWKESIKLKVGGSSGRS